MLQRLDKHYATWFDEQALAQGSKPRAEKERIKDPTFLEYERQFNLRNEQEKLAILRILRVSDISELSDTDQLAPIRAELLTFVHKEGWNCSGDFLKACEVGRRCYALLLVDQPDVRKEFADQNYRNALGDARLIKDALFLQGGILSNDKHVKRMASYVELDSVSSLG